MTLTARILALRAQQRVPGISDAAWDALEREIEPLLEQAWVEDWQTDKYREVE